MKKFLVGIFISLSLVSMGQTVIPLIDFNNYFKSFKDGFFRQIEFQPIESFKAGDNVVGYMDVRGNLIVYDGEEKMNVANLKVEYEVSDNLLIWKIGETLNLWDTGTKITLSYNTRNYWVKDNMVVFEDARYNSVKVYYNGRVYDLYSSVGDMDPPDFIGENIIAFRDNGNFNKIFWDGKIYDIDVWHNPYEYSGNVDVMAFNDPISGTFAVFDKGRFLDVEEFRVENFKAGRGFVAYENRNGDLMYYKDGRSKQISNFNADFWDVVDGVLLWEENSFMYAYVEGVKTEMTRYKPQDYLIKNEVVVFRNLMGGVSALIDGKVSDITNQMDSEYEIFGNKVLVRLFNRSYVVFANGRKYSL